MLDCRPLGGWEAGDANGSSSAIAAVRTERGLNAFARACAVGFLRRRIDFDAFVMLIPAPLDFLRSRILPFHTFVLVDR